MGKNPLAPLRLSFSNPTITYHCFLFDVLKLNFVIVEYFNKLVMFESKFTTGDRMLRIFSRGHATLHLAVSVGRSVGR